MNLTTLASWIDIALATQDVPDQLKLFCGEYYSPYYKFMQLAAAHLKNKGVSVELGCESGRGLYALGLGGGSVVGVDSARNPRLNHVLQEFDWMVFLQQSSTPIPEYFDSITQKISLLHLDTEHSYAQVQAEFAAYKNYLTSPALLIFDDLHAMDDGVLKFFGELSYPKIMDDRMHPVSGWGCLLYVET